MTNVILFKGDRIAAVSDLNGDGRNDLLVQRGALLQVLLSPDYMAANATPLPTSRSYVSATADMNGDGTKDVVIQERSLMRVAFNDGTGQLTMDAGVFPLPTGTARIAAAVDTDPAGPALLVQKAKRLFRVSGEQFQATGLWTNSLPAGARLVSVSRLRANAGESVIFQRRRFVQSLDGQVATTVTKKGKVAGPR